MQLPENRVSTGVQEGRQDSDRAGPAQVAPRLELSMSGAGKPLDLMLDGGDCRYWPNAVPASQAHDWLRRLRTELDWRQHHIELFGRRVAQPRLSAWHGDPGASYSYSGLRLEPATWTPCLSEVRDWLQAFTGHGFNSVLANLYRDGGDSMGWHSDDESELGPQPVIASLSLGAVRRFVLRRRDERREKRELKLEHGSLLIMAGDTQANWQHALPKARNVDQPRINLTVRRLVGRGV